MKTIIPFMIIIVLAGLKIQAADSSTPARSVFKPTWSGDDHDQPVFTSPTNDIPAAGHRTNVFAMPAITNWPATNLPPMTNWPATNHWPVITNPPVLQPPRGK
jgi:hypothetical protein